MNKIKDSRDKCGRTGIKKEMGIRGNVTKRPKAGGEQEASVWREGWARARAGLRITRGKINILMRELYI